MSSTELSKGLALIRNFDVNPVLFSQDDAGVYEIQGFDKFMSDADRVIEISRNADFTEDDRKNIKEARAFLNTVTKIVNRQVIDEKSRLFDTIDGQRKDVANKIKELTGELSANLDKWDAQQREIAYNEVFESFNDAMYFKIESGADLYGLKFDAINESSWFNRSASRKKVIAAMNERIDSVSTLLTMAESRSLDDVVSMLVDNDWNLGAAIQAHTALVEEERAAAAAAEAEAKRRAEELAEAERRGREAALKEMESQKNAPADDDEEVEDDDVDEVVDEEVGTVTITVTYPDNQSLSDVKIMKIVKKALDSAGVKDAYIS